MDAEGEFIDVGTLAAEVEDADFGVGYTTVEAGLGVRLQKQVESVYDLPPHKTVEELGRACDMLSPQTVLEISYSQEHL